MEVEWAVFLGTLLSNVVFLAMRTCCTHKIQLDEIPERKQLPGIDTIIAVQEVASAFGAQFIPLVVSLFMFLQPNNTNQDSLYF